MIYYNASIIGNDLEFHLLISSQSNPSQLFIFKAFAKLVGGYMKLEGGFPRCAVTYLCGGITTSDVIDESPQVQRVSLVMH